MTPKFDNLASLLMEMPSGGHNRIPDEKRLEISTYIKEFPEANYHEIAAAFGVSRDTVSVIARKLGVGRTRSHRMIIHKGKETHQNRKLTDVQEIQMLDYWMANHHEMTYAELARWIKQQFNVNVTGLGFSKTLNRVAAKHGVRLPPPDYGKGNRLRKQRDDKKRHATDPTGIPTQKPQQFRGSTGIVPSNPKHGGPAHPPISPMDQDKRL